MNADFFNLKAELESIEHITCRWYCQDIYVRDVP